MRAMKTSRKHTTERTPRRGSTVAPSPTPAPTPAPTPDPTEGSRVSFAIDASGKPVNPDRLRQPTKDALRVAFSDDEFLRSIGIRSEDDAEEDALLSVISDGAYDALSVLMLLGARRAGYSIEHARVLAFTPNEKAQLNAPTAKVIKKYLPSIGGKYRDEIMLAISLTNVIAAKIMLLRELAKAGSTVAPTTSEAPQAPQEVTM